MPDYEETMPERESCPICGNEGCLACQETGQNLQGEVHFSDPDDAPADPHDPEETYGI